MSAFAFPPSPDSTLGHLGPRYHFSRSPASSVNLSIPPLPTTYPVHQDNIMSSSLQQTARRARQNLRDAYYLQRFAATNHPHVTSIPSPQLEHCLALANVIIAAADVADAGSTAVVDGQHRKRQQRKTNDIPYPLEWLNGRQTFRRFLELWERQSTPPMPPVVTPPRQLMNHDILDDSQSPSRRPVAAAAAEAAQVVASSSVSPPSPPELRIELTEFRDEFGSLPSEFTVTRHDIGDGIEIQFIY